MLPNVNSVVTLQGASNQKFQVVHVTQRYWGDGETGIQLMNVENKSTFWERLDTFLRCYK